MSHLETFGAAHGAKIRNLSGYRVEQWLGAILLPLFPNLTSITLATWSVRTLATSLSPSLTLPTCAGPAVSAIGIPYGGSRRVGGTRLPAPWSRVRLFWHYLLALLLTWRRNDKVDDDHMMAWSQFFDALLPAKFPALQRVRIDTHNLDRFWPATPYVVTPLSRATLR